MRLIVGLSLAAVAQGLASSAAPATKADKAPIKIDKAAYTKEWHTEWKQGEVPSWKETYPKAALAYEDRQSDGKIGTFLQAKPVKADKAPIKIDKAAYTKEWHKEWKQGEVPSWKKTYPKAALPYEDRQSDGEIGFLQAEPKAAAKADKAPAKIDKAAYTKEWHKEWKQGEVPSWKETYPKAALPYEDRQSDGKIGTFVQADDNAADDEDDDSADENVDVLEQAQLDEIDDSALLQADDNDNSEDVAESEEVATDEADEDTEETEEAEDPVKADKAPTKIDKAAYAKEWHKEWKQGEVPSWKEFYPKSAHAFEDRQSDGEIDN